MVANIHLRALLVFLTIATLMVTFFIYPFHALAGIIVLLAIAFSYALALGVGCKTGRHYPVPPPPPYPKLDLSERIL